MTDALLKRVLAGIALLALFMVVAYVIMPVGEPGAGRVLVEIVAAGLFPAFTLVLGYYFGRGEE